MIGSVEVVFDGAARTLRETDFAVACPIATVALEVSSTNEQLRHATAGVLGTWIEAAAARFEAQNIPTDDARLLAMALMAPLRA